MDQVRVALAWMQKHHFWLLSGLSALLAVAGWYLGTGALVAAFAQDKAKIETAYTGIDSKAKRTFHPNADVNKAQQDEVTKLRDEVNTTWVSLYQRQLDSALKWPPQLNEAFQTYIATLKFGAPIRLDMLEQYSNYINGRFADLTKIIDANPLDAAATGANVGGGSGRGGRGGFEGGGGSFGGRGAGGAGTEDVVEENFMVMWVDQERIKADLTWPQTVSSWRVWATQEDLWVYETVLRAVAATNEAKKADRRANAAIRTINALEVGKLAAVGARGKGRVTQLAVAAVVGEEGGGDVADRGGDGEGGGDDFGRGGDGRGGDEEDEKALFLSGRYIDATGKPVPVPGGEEPLDLSLFGTEFKRLPIRLDVEMDQRWLSYLIVQLANAPLQIEIQEVRINPSESGSGGESGGRGGGGGLGFSPGGGGGGRGGAFGGGGGGGVDEAIQVFEREPFIERVVLQGVVYIFNQPDESKLKVDGDGEGAAEGAEEPTTAMLPVTSR